MSAEQIKITVTDVGAKQTASHFDELAKQLAAADQQAKNFSGDAVARQLTTISTSTKAANDNAKLFGKTTGDVNRLLDLTNLSTNTLGGAVVQNGPLTPYTLCGGEAPQPRHCLPPDRCAATSSPAG